MPPRYLTAGLALTWLAACGGGLPPGRTGAEIEALRLEARRIDKMPYTARADLPTGSAHYRGGLYSGVTGDVDGVMAATVDLVVDFRGDRLGGGIENIDLTDREGEPVQALGGRLVIVGVEDDGRLLGRATGTLRGRGADGRRGTTDLSLGLNGRVRSGAADGSAVHIDVGGQASGVLDFELFDGVIAAEAR